ncbi:MAG: hypothetical protein PHV82_15005, partial [Victivallaceae bacterium]|nr:hypothetical protein [Victivallaceae bacterium]
FLLINGSMYQFIVNTQGAKWSKKLTGGEKICTEKWSALADRKANGYAIKMIIPFSLFNCPDPLESSCTFNIFRNIYTSGKQYSTWAKLESSSFESDNFENLRFIPIPAIDKPAAVPPEYMNAEFKNELSKCLAYVEQNKSLSPDIDEKLSRLSCLITEDMNLEEFAYLLEYIHLLIQKIDSLKEKNIILSHFNSEK